MDDTTNGMVHDELQDLIDPADVPGEPMAKVESRAGVPRMEELSFQLWNILVDQAQWSAEFQGWIWSGRTSDLNEALEISQPYYQQVYGHLQRMGCVELLRRGGGGRGSILALRQPPTETLWKTGNGVANPRSSINGFQQQLRDLSGRVLRLEQLLEQLIGGLSAVDG